MKNLTKTQVFLVTLLFLFGALVRFWNFNTRLTFGPEQAISLINSAEKIDKFTLLGMPYLQRQTSNGHSLYHAPLFPYSLMPLQLIFDYNPYPITIYFTLLNLFTAFLLFYLTLKLTRIFFLSFFASFFFLFDPYMIHHSLFIWIINYFPLVGLLTIYFLARFFANNKPRYPIILGLLSGIGLGLDIAYATLFFLISILLLIPKNRLRNILYFISATLLANLPTIIFDLRHSSFHFGIFYQFFQDYLNGQVSPLIAYYHFIQFFPLYFIFLALIITLIARLTKKTYLVAILTVAFYLFSLTKSPYWDPNRSIGMPEGITFNTYQHTAQTIAKDAPEKPFNIATLHDFDTRAHPLRYLLQYVENKKPESITEYKNLNDLYVLAPTSYDIDNPKVWELQVHQPYKTSILHQYESYNLVRLTKTK